MNKAIQGYEASTSKSRRWVPVKKDERWSPGSPTALLTDQEPGGPGPCHFTFEPPLQILCRMVRGDVEM